jgi:hypothetical protein
MINWIVILCNLVKSTVDLPQIYYWGSAELQGVTTEIIPYIAIALYFMGDSNMIAEKLYLWYLYING